MLPRTLRASRQGVALLARQQRASTRRAFGATAHRQADLVQDMYLRELKNYKVPAVKSTDADGQVKEFQAPHAPKSPDEGDLASELKSYESQQPELEGQSSEESSGSQQHDWFEEEELDAQEHENEEGAH